MPFFGKIFRALQRTRETVSDAFEQVLNQKVSDESLEALETKLFGADLGFDTVEAVISVVKKHKQDNFIEKVKEYLVSQLPQNGRGNESNKPVVIMVVGVNGTGKTTTTAKLGNYFKIKGEKVLLVAADTYRDAAIEQLKIWANRIDAKIVYNEKARQPSAVLFDGLTAAKSSNASITIVDTAGRLHNHKNLMIELQKMYRVISTRFSEFEIYSLIVLDASLGQNSIAQAKAFSEKVQVNGAVLTKMDGTAKGRIVFPLFKELKIPVEFIGLGEDLNDIYTFDREEYVHELLRTHES